MSGVLDDFQLNENDAEEIQDKAIAQFQKNGYLAGLADWLASKLQSSYTEDQIFQALKGQPSLYDLLKGLCKFANIDPQGAITQMPRNSAPFSALAPFSITSQISTQQSPKNIDQLIEKICNKIEFSFENEERYSSTSGFNNANWIQNNFIDLDLVEVEFLPSQYPAVVNKEDLQNGNHQNDDDYDRLNIRLLHGTKTTSCQLLETSERIFIFGDPGSGKSSYLKWVALNCRNRTLFKEYVPLFLEVRNFPVLGSGQSLKTYFESTFEKWDIKQADLAKVISAGRGFFILDGIDEINKNDYQRLEKMIRGLLVNDDNCRFLISSRLGFNFHFSGLKKVIISPFHSRRHIPQFVSNWFSQTY
ncbi:NACHT domain-containing protein [Leptothoe spongobia]|uniref:NACHT domain-containing protein n=1 Tax=Leptothoe spongobia TAU-MAC 1115 TaxID=1967444 RepID=A0A947DKA0_9CYAN|nr:NACHT domain-containing protein [Leptothoe spongobia]MBT9317376.1 NACHT domain-containing protein [Leptothoe spongobia TAU-MAC 1115]